MFSRPSIAVVVVAHNRADLIEATVDSLLDQTADLSEIDGFYLADDCSTDSTVELACARSRSRADLQVLQPSTNVGQWGNVNHAIRRLSAQHDWVLVVHDDDLVKRSWLETMCAAIKGSDARTASVCSSWDSLNPDGTIVLGEDVASRPPEAIAGDAKSVRGTLLNGCWWHVSGCAIRTSAFLDVGDFDRTFAYSADQEWLMRCLTRGWSVTYLPRTLLVYRHHSATVSSRSFGTNQDLAEQLAMLRQHRQVLSTGDVVRCHTRLAGFAARRAARAIVQRRLAGAAQALSLVPRVVVSCATLLRPA